MLDFWNIPIDTLLKSYRQESSVIGMSDLTLSQVSLQRQSYISTVGFSCGSYFRWCCWNLNQSNYSKYVRTWIVEAYWTKQGPQKVKALAWWLAVSPYNPHRTPTVVFRTPHASPLPSSFPFPLPLKPLQKKNHLGLSEAWASLSTLETPASTETEPKRSKAGTPPKDLCKTSSHSTTNPHRYRVITIH